MKLLPRLAVLMSLAALLLSSSSWSEEKADEPGQKTVVYKKHDATNLEMVLHFPPDWKETDRRPAIVFFFGGGWTNGKLQQFEPQSKYLSSRGMVAARADYRVKSRHNVTPDQCVADARSAVRFLRQNAGRFGIDADRIVAAGGSAGGHIAACTFVGEAPNNAGDDLQISARPNAMVLFNPVVRFTGIPMLMERLNNNETLGKSLSPTLHLTKETPPALLLFGSSDRLLPQGEEYVQKAKEVGSRAELFTAADQGHGFFNRSPWQERSLFAVDEFLASLGYLKGPPTLTRP